jgi:hypothetical protein
MFLFISSNNLLLCCVLVAGILEKNGSEMVDFWKAEELMLVLNWRFVEGWRMRAAATALILWSNFEGWQLGRSASSSKRRSVDGGDDGVHLGTLYFVQNRLHPYFVLCARLILKFNLFFINFIKRHFKK